MKPFKRQELWQLLRSATLVEGEMPLATTSPTPWYIRAMLGFAGWIGALFLFSFVGVGFSFVIESAAASLIVGIVSCSVAYWVFVAAPEKDFAAQFGLALSLAGQALVANGFAQGLGRDTTLIYFLFFFFEAMLAVLLPNFIHRVATSWAAAAALSLAMSGLGAHGLGPAIVAAIFAFIWLNEQQRAVIDDRWRAIGFGLALALLQLDATLLWDQGAWMFAGESKQLSWWQLYGPMVGSAIVSIIVIWVVFRLLTSEKVAYNSRVGSTALTSSALVTLAALPAPGIATSFLVVLLGYAAGNRLLLGLGLIGFGLFLSHFYYELQTTLLTKSLILLGMGSMVLLARVAILRWLAPGTREETARA